MTNPTKALKRIVQLIEKEPRPSHRSCRIYDVALEGLGLIATQRIEMIRQNLGSHAADTFTARREQERAQAADRKLREKNGY